MYGATRARAVVLAIAATVAARPAHAEPVDEDSPRFRLLYEAASDTCPNAPAFLAAVRARTERPRLAGPGESAPVFAVSIRDEPARGQVVGRLEIREEDGTRQERVVESETCSDVAKALALVVALYLDPDATSDREPSPDEPPASPPKPAPKPRVEAPPPAPPPRTIVFGAGAAAGVLGGVGPAVAPRAGVFAGMQIAVGSRPWARGSLRLSADVSSSEANVGVGSQSYRLVTGTLRACPVRLPLASVLSLAPCAGMQAGVHRGTTSGIPNARAEDKTWLASTGTASLEVELSRSVTVELEGGVVAPLRRTRFFLAPDITLFRTPAVAGTGGVAVLVRFP
ncbi:MAG: hypothetical protein KF850_20465 [Labilithrix sp.]|nr:hypothetical protein [Labilithrix sp.]